MLSVFTFLLMFPAAPPLAQCVACACLNKSNTTLEGEMLSWDCGKASKAAFGDVRVACEACGVHFVCQPCLAAGKGDLDKHAKWCATAHEVLSFVRSDDGGDAALLFGDVEAMADMLHRKAPPGFDRKAEDWLQVSCHFDFHMWAQDGLSILNGIGQRMWFDFHLGRLLTDMKTKVKCPHLLLRPWKAKSIPPVMWVPCVVLNWFMKHLKLNVVPVGHEHLNASPIAAVRALRAAHARGSKTAIVRMGSMSLVINGAIHVEFGNNAAEWGSECDYTSRVGVPMLNIHGQVCLPVPPVAAQYAP